MKTITWSVNPDSELGVPPLTGTIEVSDEETPSEITRLSNQECNAAMIAQGLDPDDWYERGWLWS